MTSADFNKKRYWSSEEQAGRTKQTTSDSYIVHSHEHNAQTCTDMRTIIKAGSVHRLICTDRVQYSFTLVEMDSGRPWGATYPDTKDCCDNYVFTEAEVICNSVRAPFRFEDAAPANVEHGFFLKGIRDVP